MHSAGGARPSLKGIPTTETLAGGMCTPTSLVRLSIFWSRIVVVEAGNSPLHGCREKGGDKAQTFVLCSEETAK